MMPNRDPSEPRPAPAPPATCFAEEEAAAFATRGSASGFSAVLIAGAKRSRSPFVG